jgi:predicted Zn finger-like uncharacterized protein
MPEIVTCPDCGRKLRVPDALIGRKVKCPDCNTKFTGGIATTPGGKSSSRRPRDSDEDHPRRPRRDYDEDTDNDPGRDARLARQQARGGWKMTLLGMNLLSGAAYLAVGIVVVAMLCYVVVLIFGASALTAGTFSGGSTSVLGAGYVMMIAGVLMLFLLAVFLIVQVIGHGFCIAVPHKVGTARKAMAITTFAISCLILLMGLGGCGWGGYSYRAPAGLGSGGVNFGPGPCFLLLPGLLAVAYHICFMLFLHMVSTALREPGVARQVLALMIALPCAVVLLVITYITMAFLMAGSAANSAGSGSAASIKVAGALWIGCNFVSFVIYLAVAGWYAYVIQQVRNAVRDYAG